MAITNSIPDRLHDMRVYTGKDSHVARGTGTVNLPNIDYLTETLKGAGVAGEYESIAPGLLKALEFSIDWNTITQDVTDLSAPKSHYIDCRMALNVMDSGDGSPKSEGWRAVVKGVPKSNKYGKAEPSATMGTTTTLSCSYYKLEKGGKTLIEVDVLNYICNIGGTDYLEEIRSILGM
ncbi:phage major tail tube protein [Veillonella magna]|uniref:phage major tail tube protein n=1 Tax=Veillonella magna TaxID=464322 RepID=UPI0023F1734B|nr:phage major tail tube protein [Veillonella magna]